MARPADPAAVAGLPESRLSAADLADLPASSPGAPWECRARALTWVQRATPPDFDWRGTPLPLAVVSLVEYLDTPVGPYHEVLAGALLRPGRGQGAVPVMQVPFIAVDSLPSVHGGRANWALPKTMAEFAFDLPAGQAQVTGAGWSVSVRPAPLDPRARRAARPAGRQWLPLGLPFRVTGPLGRYTTRLHARGRPIRVSATFLGPALTGWLGTGEHLAVVATGRMLIDPPRPS